LANKVALALTSDLFDVLLLLLHGTKFDFLKEAMIFWEKLFLAPRDKSAKLAESSETTFQRNSFKRIQFKRPTQMWELLQIQIK
jgi:hypothetical protein